MAKVNARGLACPGPVIETKKALESLEQGIVEVLVDNEVAASNVEKLAKGLGYPVTITKENNDFALTITKGEKAVKEEAKELPNLVLFIGTDQIGTGAEELGKALMKTYLYTLTESSIKPAIVLLMNSGVKNAVEGADTLKSLQTLEEQGIEILVCGTCLDFYHLKEKLKVGRVSNMYEINEKMLQADKLVSFS